jgi:hypothetical protein
MGIFLMANGLPRLGIIMILEVALIIVRLPARNTYLNGQMGQLNLSGKVKGMWLVAALYRVHKTDFPYSSLEMEL